MRGSFEDTWNEPIAGVRIFHTNFERKRVASKFSEIYRDCSLQRRNLRWLLA